MYIVLLGLPGAGKGTQATRLRELTGLAHVTTGEIFRENIRKETPLGLKAKAFVEAGDLVPDEITIGMLLDRIKEPDCQGGCMFDGFPRTIDQANALDVALAEQGSSIDRAIYIKVDTDELVSRLGGRWSCPDCGAVYHEKNQPPRSAGVCDNCGAKLTQRADDRPDVVRKRLEVNQENLTPLLDFYGGQGKLIEIEGNREPDEVTKDLEGLLVA